MLNLCGQSLTQISGYILATTKEQHPLAVHCADRNTMIHTIMHESVRGVVLEGRGKVSYTSVRGAKMNVPMPEPQMARPERKEIAIVLIILLPTWS